MRDKIFISYRRADTAAVAGRIYDRLNALFPGEVFLDVQDIDPGLDFIERIEHTIGSSSVLVLLIGKNWLNISDGGTKLGDERDVLTTEIQSALRNRVAIIPVLIDGAPMPNENVLPTILKELARINAVDIRHTDFDHGISNLSEPIYRFLGRRPPALLERLLMAMSEKMGYDGFRIGEKQRSIYAIGGFVTGIFCAIASVLSLGDYPSFQPKGESLFQWWGISAAGIPLCMLGINSARYRIVAMIGLVLSTASFLIGLRVIMKATGI